MNSKLLKSILDVNPVALEVLDKLVAKLPTLSVDPLDSDSLVIRPWYNGRERGFCLVKKSGVPHAPALHVAWAEHRSSDSIIVYLWEARITFNPPTAHDLPQSAWDSALMFSWNEATAVAKKIANLVESFK